MDVKTRTNYYRRKKKRRKNLLITSLIMLAICLGTGGYLYYDYETRQQARAEQLEKEKAEQEQREAEKLQEEQQKQAEQAKEMQAINNKKADISRYLDSVGFKGTAYIEDTGKNKFSMVKCAGLADTATNRANNEQTIYFIGSSQKTLVATAIMQLQEQGKLQVTDPIKKYLPYFPNGDKIKVQDFLRHTSGMNPRKKNGKAITPTEIIQSIERAGAKTDPGKWDYQDDNYAVMAYLIEKVSGQSFHQYMQTHIFDPAGMKTAGFGAQYNQLPQHANSYGDQDGKQVPKPLKEDLSQFYGAGDMYLAANDLKNFDDALLSGKLISQNSLDQILAKGPACKYGYGIYNCDSFFMVHGVMYGYESINSFSADRTKKVILLSNDRNDHNQIQMNEEIMKILNKD
ncbi:serine hydrolase domain-containing protein [Listeria costaricensis]|uniref:serine hydrolase domain-containing protein n=1 Tax=Listeria costaricensis TaxID=2026604 RepID=UPI000C07966E|nr:serine hydrolase domain-containing protein [Listeria costaricensis]